MLEVTGPFPSTLTEKGDVYWYYGFYRKSEKLTQDVVWLHHMGYKTKVLRKASTDALYTYPRLDKSVN